jgi:hypothetical protein
MSYKVFHIMWEFGGAKVKDIELSSFLKENAINYYNIINIETVEVD